MPDTPLELAGCGRARLAGLVLLAVSLACGRAEAENILEVSSARGRRGDRGVEIIVTATTDRPIHGYSLAVTFPENALRLQSFGVVGTHVRALNPEFVAPYIDNTLGIATLGVIIDFNEPVAPGQLGATDTGDGDPLAPHIVARLVFDVLGDAPGGVHPVRLVDGVGTPAAANRFTNAGESIRPTLVDGAMLIEGGNIIELTRTIAIAGASPSVRITASALHPEALDGFTLAIAFDCRDRILEYKSTSFQATDLFQLVGEPDFFSSDLSEDFECRVETAVLIVFPDEFGGPIDDRKLPPAETRPQTIMRYTFSVGSAADDEQQWQDLVLENLENPVATNNLFFVGSRSTEPRRIDGKIYFSFGSLSGRVVDRVEGVPLGGLTVALTPDPCPSPPSGCRNTATTGPDGRFLIRDVIPGMYDVLISGSGVYATRHEGAVIAGNLTVSDAGDLSVYRVPAGGASFIRGNANNDPRVDLSDAIFILNFLFRGSRAAPCAQSADVNNDNKIDISDTIWMLSFFFTGGAPIPPPNTCGSDPDGGPLTCSESGC